jgi:hypothetical protein
MSLVRQCPVCPRVLRPRSLDPDASARSLRQHLKTKARECEVHRLVSDSLFHGPWAACPVCAETFSSVEDACGHITAVQDEVHAALREAHNSGISPWRLRAAGFAEREAERDTTRQQAFAARRERQGRALAARALYSAAKSGRADEVVQCLLAQDVDPNATHDDGFTALMTASEAGYEAVVDALLRHPKCEINVQNRYGQSALCLAAINGRLDVVLRLLQDERVDAESVGGGLSVAEKARLAGFNTVADIIASAAKGGQVSAILEAVTDGFASGDFDSISQRLQALSNRLAVEQRRDEDEKTSEMDMVCSVCLIHPIEIVVAPCFHACLCSACAGEGPPFPPQATTWTHALVICRATICTEQMVSPCESDCNFWRLSEGFV